MKLVKAVKVTPQVFPLTSVAGRVALLTGIAAKTVTRKELEAAVVHDTEKRQRSKPVVAYGKRYPSITAAAASRWAALQHPTLNEQKSEQAYIRKLCNADNIVGFYWSN